MEKRRLGQTELEVTPVILGTWALGGWLWGGTAKNAPEAAILASLDAGINCIDTAPVYGFGLSEELVGRAIEGRRSEVLVATKCGLVWDERPGATPFFDTTDPGGQPLRVSRCLRKESILRECDESLRRLRIDAIDLHQCHWPQDETPIDETMEALLTLRDQGKIRAFGVSNFSVEQLRGCLRSCPIASNQPKYSLLSREIEADVLPFCAEHDIGVIAYSPMEMGLLTGKITMDATFPETDTRHNRPWFMPEKRAEVLAALEKVRPVAEAYGVSLAQLSVAWVAAQPGVTAAIVGGRDGEQARSNAVAGELRLSEDALREIRGIFEPLKLDEPFDPAKAKR
jgi:aryl-alcohol dehydrogenase-like predicted oxidoreductase